MTEDKESSDNVAHIDLAALLNQAQTAIAEAIRLVAYGLTISESTEPDNVELPGTMFQFEVPAKSGAETRESFNKWLLGMGLRRLIEVYSTYLERAGLICSLVYRARHSGQEWDSRLWVQRLNRKNFPNKLTYIEDALEIRLDPNLTEQIRSINSARNCFEHRSGIVQSQDTNESGTLLLKWTGLDLSISRTEPDQSTSVVPVIELPAIIEAGSSLKMAKSKRERAFQIGQEITLSASDISELGFTLLLHAQELTAAIKQSVDTLNEVAAEP